jgi:hypothetical protein
MEKQNLRGGKRTGAGRPRKYNDSKVISIRVEKQYINQVKMQVMLTLAKLRKRDYNHDVGANEMI